MAKRTRITRPYPTHSFQDALPIAETIQRVNGGQPVETELLAEALGTSAKSSAFVQKLNASSKYGMTVGSYSDDFIQLTDLGESVTAPGSVEEREDSIIKAVTKPDIFRDFYRIYSGKRMPEDIYASNTLVRDLGVPRELTEECLGIIRRNGLVSGLVSDQGGVLMVVGVVADGEGRAERDATGTARSDSYPQSIADSETPAKYHAMGWEVLIVSEADAPALVEVRELMESLSAPWRLATLRASGGRIVSEDISEALLSAGGCVFVWPRDDAARDERIPEAKTWAALGAVSHRLGKRLAIVLSDGDEGKELGVGGDATMVRATEGVCVYPKLMAALVQTGIVRISVG